MNGGKYIYVDVSREPGYNGVLNMTYILYLNKRTHAVAMYIVHPAQLKPGSGFGRNMSCTLGGFHFQYLSPCDIWLFTAKELWFID